MATSSNNDLISQYQKKLTSSPTAYAPNVKPTSSDISTQMALMRAKNAQNTEKSNKLKSEWYSTEPKGDQKPGLLERTLNVLGAPLYVSVGAIEAMLGKGTQPGLRNIVANVKEKGTYGDLLRSYGIKNIVSAPLGLALDFALDPLNIMTMGSNSIIGGAAKGFAKGMGTEAGALKGLAAGLKANSLTLAENVVSRLPGAEKGFAAGATKGLGSTLRNVGEKASQARGVFDDITGSSLLSRAEESANKTDLLGQLGNRMATSNNPKVRAAKEALTYSPEKRMVETMTKDAEKASEYLPDDIRMGIREAEESGLDPLLPKNSITNETINGLKAATGEDLTGGYHLDFNMKKEGVTDLQYKRNLQKQFDDMYNSLVMSKDAKNAEIAAKMADMSQEELLKAMDIYQGYKSGAAKFDKWVASKIITSPSWRKFLEGYAIHMGIFKSMKIGGNIASAGMNAVVGNAVMHMLAGLDIFSTTAIRRMNDARKIINKNDTSALADFMNTPGMRDFAETYPKTFEEIYGISAEYALRGREYIEQLAMKSRKGTDGLRQAGREVVSPATMMRSGDESTYIAQDVMRGPFSGFVNRLSNSENALKRGAGWLLTKPMEKYSQIDQVYKVGTAMRLMKDGLSGAELRRLSQSYAIHASEIAPVVGRDLYRLSPEAATRVVASMYMNYKAMPSFVKIMRVLPVVGSPFMSFAYGMGAITANTAMHNLSAFNKVQFALKEITGGRSPLEKQALESPYNQWYSKDTMVKLSMLPFFQDHPVYLNVANLIPYYTMNVFQPTERTYADRFGDTVAGVLDKSPFMKTPEGQVMFDYLLQPLLLWGSDEQPKGAFDQPLWPANAGLPGKALRAGMAAAETYTPPLVGLGGLVTPSSVGQYFPNFRFRQMTFAKEGKGSTGIQTKEAPLQKVMRGLGSMAGLPTYQIDLTKQTNNQ